MTSNSTVSRHQIIYSCFTPDPAQSLFFGSGATGGTLHTPDDSLYLLISRSDLWNEQASMGAIAAVRLRGNAGLFAAPTTIRQVCRLEEATILVQLGTPTGDIELILTCLRGRDVMLLDIEDRRSETTAWSVSLENWHDGDETQILNGNILETVHLNRSSSYAAVNRSVGIEAEAIGLPDPILGRCWGLWVSAEGGHCHGESIVLSGQARHRVVIATVCAAPRVNGEAETIVRQCGQRLAQSTTAEQDGWLREHKSWWRRFWETSYLSLYSGTGEAEYEERLWYVNMYALACGMGGAYPMRFNGGTFLLDKDTRAWDHGYWGQNMRLVYYPMLAAGHFDFVREYIDWYLDNQAFVAAQTKALFGIDGLTWRETQSFWGADTASSLADPNDQMHLHFTNNLEFCQLMELYYRATGDEEFLRERFFPALRGILEFFRNYAKPGEDGKLHIQPACAVEVWSNMIDPQSEICGLHYFLPRTIAWAGRFGESPELIASWRDFAAKLPEVPVGRWHYESTFDQGIHDERWLTRSELRDDGIYLPAAGQTKERTRRWNMENAELYIVFPWGMVNLDSPQAERRRFENTWNHRTWKYQNNGWCQDTVQLARMGWREEFREALKDHANRAQRFPNGLFISPGPNRFHDLLTDTPYFDSAGVHLTALQEMFVQGYDGLLKLAPAVPESWSGSCKLYATDGFTVELEVRQGLPVRVIITATRDGAILRLKNHRYEAMSVRTADGSISATDSAAIFESTLCDADSVTIEWAGVSCSPLPEQALPDVMWPEYKIRGPLAAYRYGQWHDERRNHGQIGLEEDGMFPAVRRPVSVSGR